MNRKKLIWIIVFSIAAIAGIADATRYLKHGVNNKQTVEAPKSFAVNNSKEIILAYNAYGGIYPGLVDFAKKIISPATYPCNLCFLSFGTFGMKKKWKNFLNSIPYKKTELHKDEFKRMYEPKNLQLPVIMVSDGKNTEILVSAQQINICKTLDELINLVRRKLNSK